MSRDISKPNETLQNFWLIDGLYGISVLLLIKLINLLYLVPFAMCAESTLTSKVGAVKDIDTVAVEVACAGIPYIVFLMLSIRKGKQNVRTTLLIRRNAIQIGIIFAFITAAIVLSFSGWFSSWILTEQATQIEVLSLTRLLRVSAVGIFFIPWMYDFCGYLLGLAEDTILFKTRIFKWIIRCSTFFLIGGIALAMIKGKSPIGMVAVVGMMIGCAVGLLCLIHIDKQKYAVQIEQARKQDEEAESQKEIREELSHNFAVFIFSALFGNASKIIHAFFYIRTLIGFGTSYSDAKILYGIQEVNCSIWLEVCQILSILIFSMFLGKIENAFREKNSEKIQQEMEAWLDTVFYYLMPIAFLLFTMARPICYIFFDSENFELMASLLSSNALLVFLSSLAVACWLLLIRLQKYSEGIMYLFVGAIVEVLSFHFFVQSFGANGFVYASSLNCLVVIYLSFSKISNLTEMDYTRVLLNGARTFIALLGMNGAYVLLRLFVFDPMNSSRTDAGWLWLLMFISCILIYIFIMDLLGLRNKVHRIVRNHSFKEGA